MNYAGNSIKVYFNPVLKLNLSHDRGSQIIKLTLTLKIHDLAAVINENS